MGNLAFKRFTSNGTFTVPAGVTQVQIYVEYSTSGGVNEGDASAVFLTGSGTAYGWGSNTNGQIGDNTTVDKNSPTLVVGGLTFTKVLSGRNYSLGLTSDGKLWAWGANTNGQLGDGTTVAKSSPVAVVGGLTFSDFVLNNVTGVGTVIAWASDGTAYAWGANTQGQLGTNQNAATVTAISSPVAVVGGLKFAQIQFTNSGNPATVVGLTKTGSLFAWGSNASGQLGDNTSVDKSSPVAVVGGLTFSSYSVAAGGSVLAISTNGNTYGWGANTNGQLGDNTSTSRSSPVQVVGGLSFSQVVTRQLSSLGLTATGVAYAWGRNNNGQLGLNDVTLRSSPVQVLGGLTFQALYMNGGTNTAAYGLTTAGAAYSWGDNTNGRLGINNITPQSSPVAVVGGLTFSKLVMTNAGGINLAFGVATNGQVYGWGNNGSGQLGDGTNTTKSSPVLVVGGLVSPSGTIASTIPIPVIPNTTYSVNMNQSVPTFGGVQLGFGVPSAVTVFFEE